MPKEKIIRRSPDDISHRNKTKLLCLFGIGLLTACANKGAEVLEGKLTECEIPDGGTTYEITLKDGDQFSLPEQYGIQQQLRTKKIGDEIVIVRNTGDSDTPEIEYSVSVRNKRLSIPGLPNEFCVSVDDQGKVKFEFTEKVFEEWGNRLPDNPVEYAPLPSE